MRGSLRARRACWTQSTAVALRHLEFVGNPGHSAIVEVVSLRWAWPPPFDDSRNGDKCY